MKKTILTDEQKRLDIDLWVILIITLLAFVLYAVNQKSILEYITNENVSLIMRLLVNTAVQFAIAGLGISIVCTIRKEKFANYGLRRERIFPSIAGAIISFIPSIIYVAVSGQYTGYHPFHILITDEILSAGFPISILGMALIIIVWGFFEGFNYVVIADKINGRYPPNNKWLDYGAITCACIGILFHPIDFSFWGTISMITTYIGIYGMLVVKKSTGNAWGCIFAFCFIWNAF